MKATSTILLILITSVIGGSRAAGETADSTRGKQWRPTAATVGMSVGEIIRTRNVRKYDLHFAPYQSISGTLEIAPRKRKQLDTIYGNPYIGIGVYKPFYHESKLLGNPTSIYFLYGLTIAQLSARTAIGAEGKLGISMGWKPFDDESNSTNRIIGAKNNYHASADLFVKYQLIGPIHVKAGATFAHFSDGAYRLPNAGLNTLGGYAEVAVALDQKSASKQKKIAVEPMPRHEEYDLNISCSSRQILCRDDSTRMRAIVRHSFTQIDVSAYAMYVNSYYLRLGLGAHVMYDESINIKVRKTFDQNQEEHVTRYEPSPVGERFLVGLFAKAEAPLGYVNAVVEGGYKISLNRTSKGRAHLNLGLKTYLYKGINVSFGIQVTHNNESNCVYVGAGYTINKRSVGH